MPKVRNGIERKESFEIDLPNLKTFYYETEFVNDLIGIRCSKL